MKGVSYTLGKSVHKLDENEWKEFLTDAQSVKS